MRVTDEQTPAGSRSSPLRRQLFAGALSAVVHI